MGVREEDEEVVHVDDKPSFDDHVSEGVVHESLEGGGKVDESEKHDSWFEEAFMGDECSFPLMAIFDVDIVISPSYVKFGKNLCVFELIDEVGDQREGVGISNSVLIQISVVLVGA